MSKQISRLAFWENTIVSLKGDRGSFGEWSDHWALDLKPSAHGSAVVDGRLHFALGYQGLIQLFFIDSYRGYRDRWLIEHVYSLVGFPSTKQPAQISVSGSLVACSSGNVIYVWRNGEFLCKLQKHQRSVTALAFSGNLLVSADDREVRITDISKDRNKYLWSIPLPGGFKIKRLVVVGDLVFLDSDDGYGESVSVPIIDLVERSVRSYLEVGYEEKSSSVAVLPDARFGLCLLDDGYASPQGLTIYLGRSPLLGKHDAEEFVLPMETLASFELAGAIAVGEDTIAVVLGRQDEATQRALFLDCQDMSLKGVFSGDGEILAIHQIDQGAVAVVLQDQKIQVHSTV